MARINPLLGKRGRENGIQGGSENQSKSTNAKIERTVNSGIISKSHPTSKIILLQKITSSFIIFLSSLQSQIFWSSPSASCKGWHGVPTQLTIPHHKQPPHPHCIHTAPSHHTSPPTPHTTLKRADTNTFWFSPMP